MDNYKLHLYINALVNNEQTFEILKNKYTEILADLVSYKTNPNCSCRGRVNNFLTEKYNSSEEDKAFLESLFNMQEITESFERLFKINPQRPGSTRVISGQVFKIPKTDEGWAALNKDISGAFFKSFSILEKENHLEIYFI